MSNTTLPTTLFAGGVTHPTFPTMADWTTSEGLVKYTCSRLIAQIRSGHLPIPRKDELSAMPQQVQIALTKGVPLLSTAEMEEIMGESW